MLDLLLILVQDPTPDPTEVKAGPLGFAVWIFMILAVVVIGFSLVKQLRKAQAAKDAGVYGDEPVAPRLRRGLDPRRAVIQPRS